MSNRTHFEVQRGAVVSDCMENTFDFISQNLEYFYDALRPAREALNDGGEITFISLEDQWSFACHVEKSELGRVASGKGVIAESSACLFDEILDDLGQSTK